jgi:hypothetical protein
MSNSRILSKIPSGLSNNTGKLLSVEDGEIVWAPNYAFDTANNASSKANSSITLGSTPLYLGSTNTNISGLTLTNPVIDGFTGNTGIINIGSGQIYKDVFGNLGIGNTSPTVSLTSNGSIRVVNPELQSFELTPNFYANQNVGILVRNETPIDSTGNTYYGINTNHKIYANSTSVYTTAFGTFNNPRLIGTQSGSRLTSYGTFNRVIRGGNEPLDIANNPSYTFLYGTFNQIVQQYNANANSSIVTGGAYGTLNNIQFQIGTIVDSYGTYSIFNVGGTTNASANATNYYVNYSTVNVGSSNTALSTSTISNYYGLYLATPTVNATGAITNRWGIYQQDSAALNYFNGKVAIGTTTNIVYDQVGQPRPLVIQSSSSSTTINGSTNALTICNSDTTTNNLSQLNFAAITGASTIQYSSAIISAIHGARVNGQYPAGQLVFSTSSGTNFAPTEKVRIDSSGKLLIGTNSAIGTSAAGLQILQSVNAGFSVASSTTPTTGVSFAGWDGWAYDGSNYFAAATINFRADENWSSTNHGSIIQFRTTSSGSGETLSEKMRIDSSGNLFLNCTSNPLVSYGTARLHIDSGSIDGINLKASLTANAFNIQRPYGFTNPTMISFSVLGSGGASTQVGSISANTTNTTYTTTSDYRLKENIQPMQNALSAVSRLNPVTFDWKINGSKGQGFIAHELQAVVPDCVVGTKDAVDSNGKPLYQSVDASFLVATLTKAIQELNEKYESTIQELTQRIQQLEGK